jgi:hypothetical protein
MRSGLLAAERLTRPESHMNYTVCVRGEVPKSKITELLERVDGIIEGKKLPLDIGSGWFFVGFIIIKECPDEHKLHLSIVEWLHSNRDTIQKAGLKNSGLTIYRTPKDSETAMVPIHQKVIDACAGLGMGISVVYCNKYETHW